MPLTIDIDNDILYLRGMEKERRVLAKKMKEQGIQLALIAKITGLTEEEIRKL